MREIHIEKNTRQTRQKCAHTVLRWKFKPFIKIECIIEEACSERNFHYKLRQYCSVFASAWNYHESLHVNFFISCCKFLIVFILCTV